ncbi:DNA/RNA polymerase [Trametes coccinea BRFM310]|uniref:DNA polymerase kappa n=1 Tax=Trametes coccinea (strain BRFM310) TaxID=1353009 RepID=A0A1Y2J113_TRAC3|nr:DNA/RNA polymerase [Trametes coccinea BRFM310]
MAELDRSGSKPPSSTPDSDSLLRRLAGPSVNKAGLAKDQTEINRIIAEVSKGSKFYENEKRKDRELTLRIERILRLRDEAVQGVDLNKVEQGVDKLIAQLEAKRDLSQAIVHVDMDAFFASVEVLDNPELASKPFAVGQGVVSTASYEARKFGVRSGMATFVAKRLCPELIVLPSHFDRYSEMSSRVMSIFRRYDPTMCVAGCDEGYLNITRYCDEHSISPEDCVTQMRRIVQEETSLTVSAGIAPNKMLAKICSDKNKPNGQFKLEFEPEAIKAFMHDLSIRKVPGVGRVNERLLESIGIKTCGDIFRQRAVLSLLDKQFGLEFLLQAYLGIASNVVQPGQREERKSIGAERTFNALSDPAKIYAKLEEVATELEHDMVEEGWTGKTVTLKYKLNTFEVHTRAKSFDRWISTRKEDLFAIGQELLKPELPLTLRLIGLRVTKLKDLKAEAESKARGIKRFFGSASSTGSPQKKRRIEGPQADQDDEDHDHSPRLSQDGFAISMPGYDEDIETDLADASASHGAEPETSLYRHPTAKPKSSSGTPSHSLLSTPSSSKGPSLPPSTSPPRMGKHSPLVLNDSNPFGTSSSALECPICSRMLETDNDGLNAHIDFCLSKQAIKEAQAASLQTAVPSKAAANAEERGAGLLKYKKKG